MYETSICLQIPLLTSIKVAPKLSGAGYPVYVFDVSILANCATLVLTCRLE